LSDIIVSDILLAEAAMFSPAIVLVELVMVSAGMLSVVLGAGVSVFIPDFSIWSFAGIALSVSLAGAIMSLWSVGI